MLWLVAFALGVNLILIVWAYRHTRWEHDEVDQES